MRRLIFGWFLGSLALRAGIIVLALLWSGPVFYRAVGRHFGSGLLGYSARDAASSYESGGGRKGCENSPGTVIRRRGAGRGCWTRRDGICWKMRIGIGNGMF